MPAKGQHTSVLDRIAAKSSEVGDCWVFQGYRNKLGYGVTVEYDPERGKVKHLTHRIAYMRMVSEEIDGLDLDHLCRNTACWNPQHLEPVSHRDNIARGLLGFELTGMCRSLLHDVTDEANVYVMKNGDRRCKPCLYAKNARSAARSRLRQTQEAI